MLLAEKGQQWAEGTSLEDIIAALGAVAGNVSESPDSLLADICDWRREKVDEFGDSLGLNDDLGVLGSAGGDVGEGPGGFKLGGGVTRRRST